MKKLIKLFKLIINLPINELIVSNNTKSIYRLMGEIDVLKAEINNFKNIVENNNNKNS